MRNIQPKRVNPDSLMKSVESTQSKAIYPRITLNSKELPEIKDWSDGETYYIEMEIKQVSKSTSSESQYSNSSTFEIRKVSVDDDASEDSDE